jgi:hypothetical protein
MKRKQSGSVTGGTCSGRDTTERRLAALVQQQLELSNEVQRLKARLGSVRKAARRACIRLGHGSDSACTRVCVRLASARP